MGNDSATREAVNVKALSESALATGPFRGRGARGWGPRHPRQGPRAPAGLPGHRWSGASRRDLPRTRGPWRRLPQLHLRYCARSWNDADGLEGVQRRTSNIIKELEGMIYMASLKGLHNSNNNKRSQHIVFFIFALKRS